MIVGLVAVRNEYSSESKTLKKKKQKKSVIYKQPSALEPHGIADEIILSPIGWNNLLSHFKETVPTNLCPNPVSIETIQQITNFLSEKCLPRIGNDFVQAYSATLSTKELVDIFDPR